MSTQKIPEINPGVEDVQPKKQSWLRSFFAVGGAGLIFVAAVIAIVIGVIVNTSISELPDEAYVLTRLPGKLWIKALKAVVLPLIISSMIVAMMRLKSLDGAASGRIMGFTLCYYIGTTVLAIILGLIMANIMLIPNIAPIQNASDLSSGSEETDAKAAKTEEVDRDIVDQVVGIFENFIPQNIIDAMATDQLLAVIVTACVIGLLIPKKADGSRSIVLEFATEMELIASAIVHGLIQIAPIGIFFLLLPEIMKIKLSDLIQYVGILIASQITTMSLHWALVYPGIYLIVTRSNPLKFVKHLGPAIVTAFGTSSSAATFPVTTEVAKKVGIPEEVSRFTLPLGMTINMDGSAIGFPLYTFWMAASQSQTLNFGDMVMIAVTGTLASVGSAPIPGAGMVMVLMVAKTVNVKTEGVFALILAIDWIVDRFRTAVNVSGDLYGAAVISKLVKIEDLLVLKGAGFTKSEASSLTDNMDDVKSAV